MDIGPATMENSMEVPQKKKKRKRIELPYDPAIPLLGIYQKYVETFITKDLCTPMFFAALFTVAKTWIKKMWTYIQWNATRP